MEHEKKTRSSARKARKRAGDGVLKNVLFTLFTLCLIGVLAAGMIAGFFMKYVETTLAPVLQVNADDYTMALSSFIYYEDKETGEWKEFQTIYGEENRVWVDFEQMPEALWQAAVAIEDHRFYLHEGVDWKRTAGATVNMFIGMKDTFGGSTITQQLLKNMTEDNAGTVNRKVREIFRALEFEKNYTKEEILELYLNTIYLGQGCYGVQTAAEFYFGKDVSELTVAECASIIAITNNPSLYGPMYDVTYTQDDGTTITPRELNKKRQMNILNRMGQVGKEGSVEEDGATPYLTEEEVEAAKAEILQFTDGSTSAEELVQRATGGVKINNWFVDQVIEDVSNDLAEKYDISVREAKLKLYGSGYKVYTTMDPQIQALAESVYEDRSNLDVTSRGGQQLQSGITILDPATGNIVATVGLVGEKNGNLLQSFAYTKRQVGSSIKPLTVYSAALDAGVVTPATVFDNYPVRLLDNKPWPKNSPNRYTGLTTLTDGVANSWNTIALQTVETLGLPQSFAFATENLNLSLVPEDMDVSPLAMGGLTNGLNTVEMAAGFATFANSGIYNTPRTYLRVEDTEGNVVLENESESHVAMKETTAYLMNQILTTAINSGTGGSAKFSGMTIAGKTGTTSNNYDRYFVGYTPYYVAAVWTGYEYPENISYSGNPAITMWKKVMQPLHDGLENKSFAKPSTGLTSIRVCRDSGLLPSEACMADIRGNRVISVTVAEGTEPTETCGIHEFRNYCEDGKCLATEHCPAESVSQYGFLNLQRETYYKNGDPQGEKIVAEDDAYVISSMEAAIGIGSGAGEAAPGQEGTVPVPETPAVVGCPVHRSSFQWPWEDGPADPEDPEAWPEDPNVIPGEMPEEPEGPEEGGIPVEPREPETMSEWWNSILGE